MGEFSVVLGALGLVVYYLAEVWACHTKSDDPLAGRILKSPPKVTSPLAERAWLIHVQRQSPVPRCLPGAIENAFPLSFQTWGSGWFLASSMCILICILLVPNLHSSVVNVSKLSVGNYASEVVFSPTLAWRSREGPGLVLLLWL